jgi:hypothetical protein
MVWLTSLDIDCCGGCLESCSIFLLDSRNMGQYFLMRGWFPIFRKLEVGRLVDISTLVRKAPNRRS